MAQTNKTCEICYQLGHSKFYCKSKPKKAIKRTAIKPQIRKVTKKRQPSRSVLKKKLDKLVKDYVKQRDNYTCQRCNKIVEGTNCHASHVLPVGSHANMQFDPLNMKVLCYHDHINWWHKNPLESGEWYRQTFPERWAYLEAQDKLRIKLTTVELQEKIDYYKNITKMLDKT